MKNLQSDRGTYTGDRSYLAIRTRAKPRGSKGQRSQYGVSRYLSISDCKVPTKTVLPILLNTPISTTSATCPLFKQIFTSALNYLSGLFWPRGMHRTLAKLDCGLPKHAAGPDGSRGQSKNMRLIAS